jgi:tetratricopeptide (TPR) repeat protein
MANPVFANQTAELSNILKNETTNAKFNRYYNIAGRYMTVHDYPTAREYYSRALKLDAHDVNAISQIQQIDVICTNVSAICAEGDRIKQNADELYEKYVHGDTMAKPQCLAVYKEAKEKYNEALALSQHDEVVKHKILDVDRRLSALNM